MRGFRSFEATAGFGTAHDDVRDYFRPRRTVEEPVPLGCAEFGAIGVGWDGRG